MEPVEINAGRYYLRLPRADQHIDDRPELTGTITDPDEHVRLAIEDWHADRAYLWAIAEPTTGELLGEVALGELDLAAGTAVATCWVRADRRAGGVGAEALGAALRFGGSALGLRQIDFVQIPEDGAAARLAARCGFTQIGSEIDAIWWRWTPVTD